MSFAGFLGDVLGGAVKNDYVRDYQHASRTFRSGNYKLLPKFKNQWHVSFEFNQTALNLMTNLFEQIGVNTSNQFRISSADFTDKVTISVLVKSVKLPSYRFDIKRYNQYNRQTIGLNKITYDPINIEFHDDSLNVIRGWWDTYYMYHIQDSRYRNYSKISNQGLSVPDQWKQDSEIYSSLYTDDLSQQWGLDTVNKNSFNGEKLDRIEPFFKSIKIYHFSRPVDASGNEEDVYPHYAEYTLVNPIISAFEHDTLETNSSDPTANRMTVEYETVLYSQGIVDENFSQIASFKKMHDTYRDKAKSPLSAPAANLLGNTGLLNTASSVISGLQGGTVSPLQAALTAGKTIATWKQSGGVTGLVNSISQEARGVINASLTQVQQTAQSGNQQITVPTALTDAGRTVTTTFNKLRSLKPR